MHRETTLVALVGFALGARHFLWYRDCKRAERMKIEPEPIRTWEDEGGAVPIAPNRTAAQVSPQSS